MTIRTSDASRIAATAAAVLAALPAAYAAEDEEIAALTRPESEVRLGAGVVDRDNRRFGQYTGMTEKGAYGLLDANIVRRDDATGTWLRFQGRNLGLDHRDLRFEHERQGSWGYFIEFGQTPRFEPYVPQTAVGGIGGNTLTVPTASTPGGSQELKTERKTLGLGFDKHIGGPWGLQLRFKNEEKDGARLFGRGTTTGSTFEFTPEPIDSTTRQWEAIVNYGGERLQLAGGYYGSMYENAYKGLFITGGSANLAGFSPIALPPDNQSHQFYLSGGYQWTRTMRSTFKLAYGQATQTDDFLTPAELSPTPVVPGVPGHLNGRVDTKLAQLGITAQPLPRLSLRASARYEDRDDKTPLFRYNNSAIGTSTFNGDNEPRSVRTTAGTLEAGYRLPLAFRLKGGIDYEEKKRNTSPVRIVTHRDKTEETTVRAELRRALAESVTGAVAVAHSERTGSAFLVTTLNNGTPALSGNRVAPIHLADRGRDLLRLTADWQVTEPLSFQFRLDTARDNYDTIHELGIGPRKGEFRLYALDANWVVSQNWQATAWISSSAAEQEQAQHTGTGTAGLVWAAFLKNTDDSFGFGLRGKPSGVLEVGGDVSHSNLRDRFDQRRLNALSPATVVAPLPDIGTRLTRIQLFARYALQKNSGVRLDYVHDRYTTNDWTWTGWRYADGTTLVEPPSQKVNLVGLSYYHRFQ
jgi:MtrB/PioB family decaheme-associated outer membrane protein